MAATYNPQLRTDKDWVRFLSGDRDVFRPRLQDEEIRALLTEHPNRYYAAAAACEMILARTGGLVMKEVGDLRLQFSDKPENAYTKYISSLRQQGARRLTSRPKEFRVL